MTQAIPCFQCLVAEIEYRVWTTDEKHRHASYKGLRERADADDIYEIE